MSAGSGKKKGKLKAQQLVAIPVLKIAASRGEKSDVGPFLHEAPVEGMIAAPPKSLSNKLPSGTGQLNGPADL